MQNKIYLILVIIEVLSYGLVLELASRRLLEVRPGLLRGAARLLVLSGASQLPLWIGDENLLFLLAGFLLVFNFCYQGQRPARLTVGMVFFTLLMPVNMLVDTLIREYDPWGVWGAVTAGIKLAFALAVWLALRCFIKKPLELAPRLWGLCALLSAAPLLTELTFVFWNGFINETITRGQLRIAYTLLPFAALSAAAVLSAMAELSRRQELEQAARLAQMRELYYSELRQRQNQLSTLRHDLRNHLGVLQGFLEGGETDKAKGYLQQLNGSPALTGGRRVCENEAANVVITSKLEEMERRGLTPDMLVNIPEGLTLPDVELCALLGNALDNAIEAAADAEDKHILLRARTDKGMLMLRVENAFSRPPVFKDGQPVSAKGESHGLGLSGMREIARRRGGSLEVGAKDGRFELVACLPLGEE